MRIIAGIKVLMIVGLISGCVSDSGSRERDRVNEQELLQSQISLGVGYMRNRNYERARENLQRALKIDPRSAVAHNYFGLLYQLEGEPEVAEEYFKNAIRYDRDYSAARNNYGAFLYDQGRYGESIKQLELAAADRAYRNRAQVFENLGIAYLKLNHNQAALEALQRSVELNPGQARALLEIATHEFEERNYARAREFYSRFVDVSGQSPRSLWLGIRLARVFDNEDDEASLSMALRNLYSTSPEFKEYQRSKSE